MADLWETLSKKCENIEYLRNTVNSSKQIIFTGTETHAVCSWNWL